LKMKYRITSLALALLMVLSAMSACSKAEKPLTAAELLDLGNKYLLELNYEQAIIYFLGVIDIEPKNPRAYIGAAEAYIGLNEPQKAAEILHQGIAAVSAEDITALNDMLTEVEGILLTMNELVDIPPLPEEAEATEPVKLSVLNGSPFDYIGLTPEELTSARGAYENVTLGDSGNMFRYGDMLVAFDRETNGMPDSDGFAYMLIVPLASIIGRETGNAVEVSALSELFGQAGGFGGGKLECVYNGVSIMVSNIPTDGMLPIDSTVTLSVAARPSEFTPTPTPTPAPPSSKTEENQDYMEYEGYEEYEEYEIYEEYEEYEEYEIELNVVRS